MKEQLLYNQDTKERVELKVLAVDDEPDNLFLIKTYLKNVNVKYYQALNSKKALEYSKEIKFDFILMDIKMPNIDGVETTKMIRADSVNKDSYIIALSACSSSHDNDTNLFDDFVGKPFSKKDLFSKLSLSLMH